MSKEKLYGLRDQLSKFLYDPTPDQAAWRDKMWNEGRFDESIKITKQVEEQLEGVEEQIAAVEAAEPSIGEKLVTNFLLNLPLGKQLKGTGLGPLLGMAEEEVGAAEAQRLKDIEQRIHQLNAVRQKDLEGGKVWTSTINKMDADIRTLEQEKEGIMSLIGKTPTTVEEALEAEKETFHNKYFNKRPPPPGKFEKSAVKAKEGGHIPGETSQLYRSSWIKTQYAPNEFDENGPRRKYYEITDLFDLPAAGLTGVTRETGFGDQFDRLKDARAVAQLRENRALARIEKAARDGNTDYIEEIRAEIVDFRGTWAEELFQIKFKEAGQRIGSGREGLAEDLIDLANRAEHLLDKAVERGETSIKGYQSGGLVMNYGDYGRSYK